MVEAFHNNKPTRDNVLELMKEHGISPSPDSLAHIYRERIEVLLRTPFVPDELMGRGITIESDQNVVRVHETRRFYTGASSREVAYRNLLMAYIFIRDFYGGTNQICNQICRYSFDPSLEHYVTDNTKELRNEFGIRHSERNSVKYLREHSISDETIRDKFLYQVWEQLAVNYPSQEIIPATSFGDWDKPFKKREETYARHEKIEFFEAVDETNRFYRILGKTTQRGKPIGAITFYRTPTRPMESLSISACDTRFLCAVETIESLAEQFDLRMGHKETTFPI